MHYQVLHIEIPPDRRCRSHLTQYRWGYCTWNTIEGTLGVPCSYCMDRTPATVAVSSKYPQHYSNLQYCWSFETYIAGRRNWMCRWYENDDHKDMKGMVQVTWLYMTTCYCLESPRDNRLYSHTVSHFGIKVRVQWLDATAPHVIML